MNKKQSLFHIAKRDALPWYKSFAIRGCAIVLALIVCAVVTMLMTGENPVSIYATIFKGAFGSARKSWVTFQNLAVLLGISKPVIKAHGSSNAKAIKNAIRQARDFAQSDLTGEIQRAVEAMKPAAAE